MTFRENMAIETLKTWRRLYIDPIGKVIPPSISRMSDACNIAVEAIEEKGTKLAFTEKECRFIVEHISGMGEVTEELQDIYSKMTEFLKEREEK